MSYQDKITTCTDALTALRAASSVRDMEILPISFSCQMLTEDFRAGICDPASTALASAKICRSFPGVQGLVSARGELQRWERPQLMSLSSQRAAT